MSDRDLKHMQDILTEYGVVKIDGDIYSKNKTLTAYVKDPANYEFAGWGGDATGSTNPIIIACDSSKTMKVVARFRKNILYHLDAICDSSKGMTQVENTSNKKIKIATAIPLNGYVFDHWDGIEEAKKRQNPLTYAFTNDTDCKKTIIAIFAIDTTKTYIYKTSSKTPLIIDVRILTAETIGRRSFQIEDYTISNVILGSNVTSIAEKCFMNCKNLRTIEIPDNSLLTSIGQCAFLGAGIEHLDLRKANLNIISNETFSDCMNLIDIYLNSRNIERISYSAFSRCIKLLHLNEGEDNILYASIDDYAFAYCKALEAIKIANNSKNNRIIGEYAFYNCNKLKLIDLRLFKSSSDMSYLPSVFDSTFGDLDPRIERKFIFDSKLASNIAYTKDGWSFYAHEFEPSPFNDRPTLMRVTAKTGSNTLYFLFEKFETPTIDWGDSTVDSKPRHKYSKNGTYTVRISDDISSFKLSNSTTVVGIYIDLFGSKVKTLNEFPSKDVKKIAIPNSLLNVQFGLLRKLNLNFSNDVIVENGYTFLNLWAVLEDKSMINLVNTISEPRSIEVPNGVQYLTQNCFRSTNIKSLRIPASVRDLHIDTFIQQGTLTSIVVDQSNAFLDSRNNCNAIIRTLTSELIAGVSTTNIPESVKIIGSYAFRGLSRTSYTMPSSIKHILRCAFSHNSKLTSLDMSKTTLDDYAIINECTQNKWFENCYDLGDIEDILNADLSSRLIRVMTKDSILNYDVFSYANNLNGFNEANTDFNVRVVIAANEKDLTGTSRDADDFEKIMLSYTSLARIIKLKNSRSTISAVKTAVQNAVNDASCNLLVFMYSGHGGLSGSRLYMCMYDGNLYDDQFWPLIKNASCQVVCIFDCCHSGSIFLANSLSLLSYELNLNNKILSDFGLSAKRFFALLRSQENGLLKAATDPKLLVWSACADDEVSWCLTKTEYDVDGAWKKVGEHIGHMMFLLIIRSFEHSFSYEEMWAEISTGYYATANQHHIEYDNDYDAFAADHPSELYLWNGPTPTKTILGGFDESQICFTNRKK